MTNSSPIKAKSSSNTRTPPIETFRVLYPIFKEEVYRRRIVMGQIARYGVLFFLSVSFFVFYFGGDSKALMTQKLFAVGGVVTVLALMIYQITQEKSRHEQAKLQLITLEEGFGFFDSGRHLPSKPLYPEQWKKRPKIDAGLVVSIGCLSLSALFLVLSILS